MLGGISAGMAAYPTPAALLLCMKATQDEKGMPTLEGVRPIVTTDELAAGVYFYYSVGLQEPGKSYRIRISVVDSKQHLYAKAKRANQVGLLAGHAHHAMFEITPGPILFVLHLDDAIVASCWVMIAGAPVPAPSSGQ